MTPTNTLNRKNATLLMMVAGFHDDRRLWNRVYVQTAVSFTAGTEAWLTGQQARRAGVACSCAECRADRAVADESERCGGRVH